MNRARDSLILICLVLLAVLIAVVILNQLVVLDERANAPEKQTSPTPAMASSTQAKEAQPSPSLQGEPEQATAGGYMACMVERNTEMELLFSNNVSIGDHSISLGHYLPSDTLALVRASCQAERPAQAAGPRPTRQCIREALIAVENEFGFVVSSSSERDRRLAGLIAWDLCNPYGG